MEMISKGIINGNPGIQRMINEYLLNSKYDYWWNNSNIATTFCITKINDEDILYGTTQVFLSEGIESLKNTLDDETKTFKYEKTNTRVNMGGIFCMEKYSSIQEKAKVLSDDGEMLTIEYGYTPTKYYEEYDYRDLKHKLFMTDKTYPGMVLEDGTIVNFPIYYNAIDDEYFIFFDKGSTEMGKIPEKEPQVVKIEPLKWLVDKTSGIALSTRPVVQGAGRFEKGYSNSRLHEFLHSREFLKVFNTPPGEEVEYEDTSTREETKKTIFNKKKKPTKLVDILNQSTSGNRLPYLVGHPGVGKTAIVQSLTPYCHTINVSSFTPDMFTGKTGIVNQTSLEAAQTKTFEPEWHRELIKKSQDAYKESKKCILFIDEFDKLVPQMQVFINSLVETPKKLAGWVIPSNVDIILAGNTPKYSDTSYPISGEVESRLLRFDVKPDFKAWLAWANTNGVDPIVINFLVEHQDMFIKDIKNEKGKFDFARSLTPRSWVQKISEALIEARNLETYPVLDQCMSQEDRLIFEDYIEKYQAIGNSFPEDIVRGMWDVSEFVFVNELEKANMMRKIASLSFTDEALENSLRFVSQCCNSENMILFMKHWKDFFNTPEDIQRLRLAANKVIERNSTYGK